MPKKIAFLMGVHAHQPVGNFPSVLADAHQRCYGPFLRLMARFPEFPFALHVSGWLLDQWLDHDPEDMELLKIMVRRGQAELFTAGYAEPVLAAIPEADRRGQVQFLSQRIHDCFGVEPGGSWLTERVWESSVVSALHRSGVRYVTVDDYHFLCAGVPAERLNGYFTTEEGGERLDIFPIAEGLRYRIPFTQANEVVSYLESMARDDRMEAAIYFDDIEKFGIWPETYEWVYEKGWLEQFIQGVLNSPFIEPMTYARYHAQNATRGPVYLPTTSYIEMNEWTLPAQAGEHYAHLVERARNEQTYGQDRPFLRGGIWRNFMMRYPEANHLHKRMLGLSARFHALPALQQTAERRRLLYETQANDAYWHGLFGGLYLPHLRRALYHALLQLEADLDRHHPRPALARYDLDLDGHEEIVLQNGQIQAIIAGNGPAHVLELDVYELAHNFADTLTRQREHYHAKVLMQPDVPPSTGLSNPHNMVQFKHPLCAGDLVFDSTRRALFTDYARRDGERCLLEYDEIRADETDSGVKFLGRTQGARKEISLLAQALLVRYEHPDPVFWSTLEIELNLVMPSCDGPAGRFEFNGEIPGGFGQDIELNGVTQLVLRDEVLGGGVTVGCNMPCRVTSRPCHSVSQSEAGFEKIMQAVTLIFTDFSAPVQNLLMTLTAWPTS
ncbi:alpha-amylase/4-alpha-glucanotransferase domain-containing protein [Ferrovum sp.]|uniref:alpha-amylase/4-alpha-glucanotransferase domain-containing protein n=1 Tax=Ferrovum sp. TaxID=2609467 RepID=UPI002613F5C6|nr:alpha-amylase/4-alpha-glucanotransferase domain-containing protein [Ferrovum sp.]